MSELDRKRGRERTDGLRGRQAPPPGWTIGHSTLELDDFLARLAAHRIEQVADVRRYPASRRHPQFNREVLAEVLPARGVRYRWFEALGGRRPARPAGESPNRGIESAGFRGYADYALGGEFEAALAELTGWMEAGRTAILCAELLWWQCHRRLIADQLVARGGTVYHVRDDAAAERHALWDLARVTPEGVFYPPTQAELDLD
jgi:uncharacterized protein (DUF488 family)